MSGATQSEFRPVVIALLLLLGVATMPLDRTLTDFLRPGPLPGEFDSLVHKAEVFGHGYGILGIAFTIYLVNPHLRAQLARLLSGALLAGLASDVVKLLVYRVRPSHLEAGAQEAGQLSLKLFSVDNWQGMFESAYQSFPSAHTATAVAFAIGLGRMYPSAAKWFLALSALVAASRIVGMSHFLSDTIIGAAVGYTCGAWVWRTSRSANAWERSVVRFLPTSPRTGIQSEERDGVFAA